MVNVKIVGAKTLEEIDMVNLRNNKMIDRTKTILTWGCVVALGGR